MFGAPRINTNKARYAPPREGGEPARRFSGGASQATGAQILTPCCCASPASPLCAELRASPPTTQEEDYNLIAFAGLREAPPKEEDPTDFGRFATCDCLLPAACCCLPQSAARRCCSCGARLRTR